MSSVFHPPRTRALWPNLLPKLSVNPTASGQGDVMMKSGPAQSASWGTRRKAGTRMSLYADVGLREYVPTMHTQFAIRHAWRQALVCAWLALAAGNAPGQPGAPPKAELPGPRPDGSVLLPNQWSLRPAGRQVPLGDFPVNIAVHPGGAFAAVMHSGHGRHEIVVVDLHAARA